MLDRRRFLATAALAGAAVPLARPVLAQDDGDGHAPLPAQKPNAAGKTQAAAFRRHRLGDLVVTAIGDGGIALPAEVLIGVSADSFAAAMRAEFLPEAGYPASINAFVVDDGNDPILIDCGAPAAMGEGVGHLPRNLEAAGYRPADIRRVLLTHMHGDHIGNLIDASGAPLFPDAEVVVRDRELTFWTDPAEAGRIPEMQKMFADLAKAVKAAYGDRIKPFAGDVAVVDGIEAVALYGHTPGHTGYRIGAGSGLLVWGDIMHVAPVQLAKPDVAIVFDVDAKEAVATRAKLLDSVAAERTMIAGMHLPFPGTGHVTTAGAGYRFVPAPYDYAI